MRGFLKKLRAALKTMSAMMTQMVLVQIKAAGGAIDWIWEAVTNRNVVDCGPDVSDSHEDLAPEAAPRDAHEVAHTKLGELVLRAAAEVLRFGEVRSGDVPTAVSSWLTAASRETLFQITRHDALAVGRHVAGVQLLKDEEGFGLPRPDREEDAKRLERRRAAEAERKSAWEAARRHVRERQVVEDLAQDAPVLARLVA